MFLKIIAKMLRRFPVKSILISTVIIVTLVFGVKSIYMDTGNNTLVKSGTDVYQDNLMLEEEFGGESIIVLYESENLLTPRHLKHMKGIENALITNDSIYSMLSPVTLVEEIAGKQSDTFQDGVSDIIAGLDDMGNQLIKMGVDLTEGANINPDIGLSNEFDFEIPELDGAELPKFALQDINGPQINENILELDEEFSNMIEAQENLGAGTKSLVNGYDEFSKQLNEVGGGLLLLANSMDDSSEKEQLTEASQKLSGLSKQMSQTAEATGQLPAIPDQTMNALKSIQAKLNEQVQEQKDLKEKQQKLEKQMQVEMQKQQEEMKQMMKDQQRTQKSKIKAQMKEQQNELEQKQQDQVNKLITLAEGLSEMGVNLQSISENMQTIVRYSDIMYPRLPEKQSTLDNIIYDNGKLRSMFEEVVIDDHHMVMMIKFTGNTTDEEMSEAVTTINTYLDVESLNSVETIVSGKPVLDNSIRSSMEESIQKMMALALLIMIVILFFAFKVRWRLLPLLIVLIAVVGTVGLMGWLQIPITMVSMAVFPILIGLGIDYAIQFQNRYTEELRKEDLNE